VSTKIGENECVTRRRRYYRKLIAGNAGISANLCTVISDFASRTPIRCHVYFTNNNSLRLSSTCICCNICKVRLYVDIGDITKI